MTVYTMRKVFTKVWTTDFKRSWESYSEMATESQIEYTRQQIIEFLRGKTGCYMLTDDARDNIFIPREAVGYIEIIFLNDSEG